MRRTYAFLEPETPAWRTGSAIALFFALILVAPFFTALFFPPASEIFSGAVGLASLLLLRVGTFTGAGNGPMPQPDADAPVSPFEPHLWVVAYAAYMLLTNLWAASLHASLGVTLINISGVLVFLLVRDYAEKIRRVVPYFFAGSAIAVYLYGVGDAVHWWTVLDGVYDNGLLASVFQYHNTFGAFELAMGSLAYLTLTRLDRDKRSRWWWNILGYFTFIIAIDSDLGSYSRIVWLITPFALAGIAVGQYLIERRRSTLTTFAVALIFSGLSAYLTLRAVKAADGRDLVLSLLIAAVGAVLAALTDRFARHLKISRKLALSGAGGIAVLVLGLLFALRHHLSAALHSIGGRLSSISLHSVSLQERFTYYRNAIHMWLGNPILGAGGGTWHAKFQAYQSLPYWSEQVHSVFFDVLLNFGVIGVVLFLFVLAGVVMRFVQGMRESDAYGRLRLLGFLIAAAVMLGHALFDFDFAFGFYQYVFWTALGLAVYDRPFRLAFPMSREARRTAAEIAATRSPGRTVGAGDEPVSASRVVGGVGYAVTALLSVGAVLVGTSLSVGHIYAAMANSPTVSPNAKLSLLQTAAAFAPYNASTDLELASIYFQNGRTSQAQYLINQGWATLQSAAALDPWNPLILSQAAVLAYQIGQGPTAVQWAAKAWQDAPYETQYAADLMGLTMWTSASELHSNRPVAESNLRSVLAMYRTFQARAAKVNPHLFPGDTPLQTNASMQVYLATSDYLLKNYRQSLKELNPFLKNGRDQGATALYMIVTVLDDAKLRRHTKQDAAFLQQIRANPSAQTEFNFLQQAGG